MITAIVGSPTRTNAALAQHWRARGVDARVIWPNEALVLLDEADIALFRLDVLPTLDGVEPGLAAADALAARGVRVLNRSAALLAAHDKLATAKRLRAAGLRHPTTRILPAGESEPWAEMRTPCVVKPRFGSWGQDVYLCRTSEELDATVREISGRPWFAKHGALVQDVVGPARSDLRLVVAGGTIVAAGTRVAAALEWRTNVSLGGKVTPVRPSEHARELAIRAAAAIGIDLAGVDLLPLGDDWVVLELNGAVDFDGCYAIAGADPYAAILPALEIGRPEPPTLTREEDAMSKTVNGKPARPGDEIVITGHAVGDAPRTAVILGVLGDPGHERFHVRWEDGHESIYFPADDAVVRRPTRRTAPS